MLPDFPKQKAYFSKKFSEAVANRIRSDPLIGNIPIRFVHEGRAIEVQSPQGFKHLSEFAEEGFQSAVSTDELIKDGPNAYTKQINTMAEHFVEAQHKMLLTKLNEVSDKHGMTVDARGQPFSPDMLLEGLEHMNISFDEAGAPKLPSMVAHPTLAEKMRQQMASAESNLDYKKKFDSIIEKKRKEWLDRENNRKLVD